MKRKSTRVYLSSTFEDLKDYRAAVSLALERAGLQVARMEGYVAADERPLDLCLQDVATVDVYIGLFAWRYGYVPPADHGNTGQKSISELEFERARHAKIPALVFLAAPDTLAAWPDRFVDAKSGANERGARIGSLRATLGRELTTSFFSSPDQLAALVLSALFRQGLGERPFLIPALPAATVARPQRVESVVRELATPGRHLLVHGSGGFGKTRLVLLACHDPALCEVFDGGMLWVTLGERPDVHAVLRDLYTVVVGEVPAVAGTEALARALAKTLADLAGTRRCLLVVDDVWHRADLQPFLEIAPCTLVVTSRQRDLLGRSGQLDWAEVSVQEMHAEEAAALLGRGLALDEPVAAAVRTLADELGCWPLLLGLVNARVQEETRAGRAVADAVALVRELFSRRGVLGFDPRDAAARNDAVSSSVGASLDYVDVLYPGLAARAPELAVFAEDQSIPVQVLAELWGLGPADAAEDMVRPLHNNCLLVWDRASDTVTLHDMVRAVLRERLADPAAVHTRLLAAWGDPLALPHAHAWRWYGWHCIRAGEAGRLHALLGNFRWLQGLLRAAGIVALCGEFDRVEAPQFTRRIGAALLLSADVLAGDADQLAPHLIARLAPAGATPADSQVAVFLADIEAAMSGQQWLRPLSNSLVAPGGSLVRTIDVNDGRGTGIESLHLGANGTRAVVVKGGLFGAEFWLTVWDLGSARKHNQHRLAPTKATGVAVDPGLRRAVFGQGSARTVGFLLKPPELPAPRHTVEVIDLDTGATLHSMVGHVAGVVAVAHAPDDALAASASSDGCLILWDLVSGQTQWRIDTGSQDITHLSFSPDGRLVVAAGGRRDPYLRLWRTADAQLHARLGPFPCGLRVAAVSPDGKHIAVAADDHAVHWWSLAPCTALAVLEGHEDPIHALALTPDGRALLSAAGNLVYSPDNTVRVWDLQQRRVSQILRGHGHRVTGVACLPDGRQALSASWDDKLRLWRLDGAASAEAQRHDKAVNTIAVTPDGRLVLSGGDDGWIKVWDADTGRLRQSIDVGAQRTGVSRLAVLPGGQRVLSVAADYARGADVELAVWDILSGVCVQRIGTLKSTFVDALALAPDGLSAVTADRAGALLRWDLVCGDVLGQVKPVGARAVCVGFMPDGESVVFGSADGAVQRWALAADRVTTLHHTHKQEVRGFRLSADARWLATTDAGGVLVIWAVDRGTRATELPVDEFVFDLAFSPNGLFLMASSGQGLLRIWKTADWSLTHELQAHRSAIYDMAIAPDGRYVVTCSVDETVRVWAVASGQQVGCFRAEGGVNACAAGVDGRTFIAGDRSGGVHFLRIEP